MVFIEVLRIRISSEQNKTNSGNAILYNFCTFEPLIFNTIPNTDVFSVQFYTEFFPPFHIQSNLGFSEDRLITLDHNKSMGIH